MTDRIGTIDRLLCLALLALNVVFPNVLREINGALLVLAAIYYFSRFSGYILPSTVLRLYVACAVVSLIYGMIGYLNGAPSVALLQVVIIYLAGPLLWICICTGLLRANSLDTVVRVLVFCTALCILSHVYYVWAFVTWGPAAVSFLVENPNVRLAGDGSAGSVMYVFGSLIFLMGGLFAAPEVVRHRLLRIVLMIACVISAIASGRSALILSIAVGFMIYLLRGFVGQRGVIPKDFRGSLLALAVALALSTAALSYVFSIDLSLALESIVEKIVTAGGPGRADALGYFISGIVDTFGMGAGHGIALPYTVDPNFPWRYEMIWVASVFRVGVIGAAIYAAPYLWAILRGLRRGLSMQGSGSEWYLLGGLTAAFLATNTNPYVEGYFFQWMFVLPVAHFLGVRVAEDSTAAAIEGTYHWQMKS